jgi:hypothetical protein
MNQNKRFWTTFVVLLLIGYFIWTRIAKTASDAGTAADNLYIHPLKSLFS